MLRGAATRYAAPPMHAGDMCASSSHSLEVLISIELTSSAATASFRVFISFFIATLLSRGAPGTHIVHVGQQFPRQRILAVFILLLGLLRIVAIPCRRVSHHGVTAMAGWRSGGCSLSWRCQHAGRGCCGGGSDLKRSSHSRTVLRMQQHSFQVAGTCMCSGHGRSCGLRRPAACRSWRGVCTSVSIATCSRPAVPRSHCTASHVCTAAFASAGKCSCKSGDRDMSVNTLAEPQEVHFRGTARTREVTSRHATRARLSDHSYAGMTRVHLAPQLAQQRLKRACLTQAPRGPGTTE